MRLSLKDNTQSHMDKWKSLFTGQKVHEETGRCRRESWELVEHRIFLLDRVKKEEREGEV